MTESDAKLQALRSLTRAYWRDQLSVYATMRKNVSDEIDCLNHLKIQNLRPLDKQNRRLKFIFLHRQLENIDVAIVVAEQNLMALSI